jgi:hypothetical protein
MKWFEEICGSEAIPSLCLHKFSQEEASVFYRLSLNRLLSVLKPIEEAT